MSEFSVVKCKKCDAALTEIVGQKLTECVQCGYSFNLLTNENKFKRPHTLSRKIKETPEYKRYLKKIQHKNFSSHTFDEGKNTSSDEGMPLATKKTEHITLEKLIPKKSIVGAIVKWYFIIFISISVLSQCFNR